MNEQLTPNPIWQRLLPIALIICLPILAVVVYANFFSPGTETRNSSTTAKNTSIKNVDLDSIVPVTKTANKKIPSVNDMTVKLAARLETSPDDPSGWLLLAKSYEHIQESGKAREAYAKALQYGASDAELEKRLIPATETGQ